MKKRIHVFLSFLLALILTACGAAQPADLTGASSAIAEDAAIADVSDDGPETEAADGEEEDGTKEDPGIPKTESSAEELEESGTALPQDGTYTSKEDVALYLHLYGCLPPNFITKQEAEELGWEGGSLEPYAPGKCIGGSRFGNYEGLLPKKDGRTYQECDIDTLGAGSRGAKRIVYSNDGLVYYTEDHYGSFALLYGEDE